MFQCSTDLVEWKDVGEPSVRQVLSAAGEDVERCIQRMKLQMHVWIQSGDSTIYFRWRSHVPTQQRAEQMGADRRGRSA